MAHAPCTALDTQPMRSYWAVRIEQPHLFDTIALYILKPAMRARGRRSPLARWWATHMASRLRMLW